MAITNVVFANVSSLAFTGVSLSGALEACTGFQCSRGANVKPIFKFESADPAVLLSSQSAGNASFTYTISNGTNSGLIDWSGVFKGAGTLTCTGVYQPAGTGGETVALTGVSFAGQSIGMSAKNEMTCTVNVLFTGGSI